MGRLLPSTYEGPQQKSMVSHASALNLHSVRACCTVSSLVQTGHQGNWGQVFNLSPTPGGGRPLGSGRQLPPQLSVGLRPLRGGGGGIGGGVQGGAIRGGV